MVLRGEQIQRCGLGGCIVLTNHTLFKQTADLYPNKGPILAWSGPCEPASLSLPEPVSGRMNAVSHGTLAAGPIALVLKGGRYVVPL